MQLTHKYSPIGIDIGRTSVKMVQFRKKGSGLALQAAGQAAVEFPSNSLGPDETAATVKALKKTFTQRKFFVNRAVITPPATDVDVRPLTLPAGSHDVAKMVRWEAESYLAYPAEDAVIDHVVLGQAKSAGETRLEVLAAAVHRDKITASLDLIARTGLVTQAVDIVPLALARLLDVLPDGPATTVAAVDLGAYATHAVILDNHELRMSRTIDIGGERFTAALCEALEIQHDEADVLKCQHGTGVADDAAGSREPDADAPPSDETRKIAHIVHDILRDKLDYLATELSKLFRYFSAQNQGRRVEKVYLVGGGGALKHLDAFLAERLDTQVNVAEPLIRLTGGPVELKHANQGAYAVATGLALREL